MVKRCFIGIAALVFLLMIGVVCNSAANTIGANFSQAVDDVQVGITGDYEKDLGLFDLGIEGDLNSGDVILGNVNVSATFDVASIGVRLESNNKLKGFTIDSLGRTNDVGASLVVPINALEFSVGLFGETRNPFSPVYELDNPSDPTSAVLKDQGITIKDGSSLNAAITTAFDVRGFEIGIRALVEVLGKGQKAHQLVADIGTSGDLFGTSLDWTANLNIAGQKLGNTLEYESSVIAGVVYGF